MNSKDRQIVVNSLITPDGTRIVSKHRHDYVTYIDKSRLVFSVDGGNDYLKRSVGFSAKYNNQLSKNEIDYIIEKGIFYCPVSGRFFDKKSNYRDTVIDTDGYRLVYLGPNSKKQQYKAHRLVFMFSGIDNIPEIDHKNGIRSDNRWLNLRIVKKEQNQANSRIRIDNTEHVKGLTFNKNKNRYVGRVQKNGKRFEVSHKNKETCIKKLHKLRSIIHSEFTNHGLHSDKNYKAWDYYKEDTVYFDEAHIDEKWELIRTHHCRGGRGKNGDQPLKWVPLKEMSNEWLQACIDYNTERNMAEFYTTKLYILELNYRKINNILIKD